VKAEGSVTCEHQIAAADQRSQPKGEEGRYQFSMQAAPRPCCVATLLMAPVASGSGLAARMAGRSFSPPVAQVVAV
jgi:hypothetical protein